MTTDCIPLQLVLQAGCKAVGEGGQFGAACAVARGRPCARPDAAAGGLKEAWSALSTWCGNGLSSDHSVSRWVTRASTTATRFGTTVCLRRGLIGEQRVRERDRVLGRTP